MQLSGISGQIPDAPMPGRAGDGCATTVATGSLLPMLQSETPLLDAQPAVSYPVRQLMDGPNTTSWKLTVRCAECGAELAVEPDRHFVDCDHCHATSVVDLGGTATCFRLKTAFDEEHLSGNMKRWLRKQDLKEGEENLERVEELLIPFWTFRARDGERSLLAVDRAELPLARDAQKPPGQLEPFGPEEAAAAQDAVVEPSVPLPAALTRSGLGEATASLVYVPFVRFRYEYRGQPFQALVDAASGEVHASSWPRPFNRQLDQRLGLLLAAALVGYLGFAALPGVFWPLLAYVLLSAALWWALTRVLSSSERSP